MAITTANQAEDPARLTEMMQNCYQREYLGEREFKPVQPFIEMTDQSAGLAASELLRLGILPFRIYGGSSTTRLTPQQATRVAGCLRDMYRLPVDLRRPGGATS
jgi:hypothetical protein